MRASLLPTDQSSDSHIFNIQLPWKFCLALKNMAFSMVQNMGLIVFWTRYSLTLTWLFCTSMALVTFLQGGFQKNNQAMLNYEEVFKRNRFFSIEAPRMSLLFSFLFAFIELLRPLFAGGLAYGAGRASGYLKDTTEIQEGLKILAILEIASVLLGGIFIYVAGILSNLGSENRTIGLLCMETGAAFGLLCGHRSTLFTTAPPENLPQPQSISHQEPTS